MYVAHTIYCLGFTDYLEPITLQFGYITLKQDFILCKWNKHDEFLLLFTETSLKLLCSMLQLLNFLYLSYFILIYRCITKTTEKQVTQ